MRRILGYIGAACQTIICIVLFLACQMLALLLFSKLGIDRNIYEGSFIACYSSVMILIFSAYSAFRSYKRKRLINCDKLNGKQICILIVVGLALLGLVSLYMIYANIIAESLAPVQQELDKYSESVDRFSSISASSVPWWDVIIDMLASTLLIPLAEEMVFRGAIFGELSRKMNWVLSAFITSIIFGLFHGISIHIGYAAISGMILCLVYRYTNSIFGSYLVHAVFNLLGSSIFILFDSSLMDGISFDVDGLNVALFGVETFMIVPAIACMYLLYRDYKKKQGIKEET